MATACNDSNPVQRARPCNPSGGCVPACWHTFFSGVQTRTTCLIVRETDTADCAPPGQHTRSRSCMERCGVE